MEKKNRYSAVINILIGKGWLYVLHKKCITTKYPNNWRARDDYMTLRILSYDKIQ